MMTSPAQLILNFVGGSIKFDCLPDTARALQADLDTLVQRLQAVAQNPKRPQKPVEFRSTRGPNVEIFCNPNIWPTPFAAKVYLTLKTDAVTVSSEVMLSQLREDLAEYFDRQDFDPQA